jgi:1,4-alpha-glucan branching enzyme
MLIKVRDKKKGLTRVTFALPAKVAAETIYLVGEFNEWQATHTMKQQKDGSWKLDLELKTGGEYQFRYLVDGQTWLSEPEADGYTPNPFGDENSVVRT